MSYQITNHVIERVKVYLDLIQSRPNEDISIQSDNPHNLAYLLRQAFVAASKLQYVPYDKFNGTYKVRPKRDRVIVEFNGTIALKPPSIRYFKDVSTEDDIATIIAIHSSDYERLQFPLLFSDIPTRIQALCESFKLSITPTTNALGQQILEVSHVV